jgi:hypothetical protein
MGGVERPGVISGSGGPPCRHLACGKLAGKERGDMATMEPQSPALRPRRRWYWSTRPWLVVAAVLLAAICSALAWQVSRAVREQPGNVPGSESGVQTTTGLFVPLPDGWSDRSGSHPTGPSTYIRHASAEPGALQISLAEYKHGAIPNLDSAGLINVARSVGKQLGEIVEESSGSCALGRYGYVLFRSAHVARAQVWCLTDGHVAVLATHICQHPPEAVEIQEARAIVEGLRLTQKR